MTIPIPDDLQSLYGENFIVCRARTAEEMNKAFSLRYDVYCIERAFEKAVDHLDRREIDEYDWRSAHLLLLHRDSGAAVGTARVILPTDGPTAEPLPMQRVLSPCARRQLERFPPMRTAEISRYAVTKQFRRCWSAPAIRAGLHARQTGPAPDASHRVLMRYITFGLLRGILEVCLEHGILYLAAVMAPALIRVLSRFGVEFSPLGEPVDYHGIRQPCIAALDALVRRCENCISPLAVYLGLAEWRLAGERAALTGP